MNLADVQDRLQQALGTAYAIERELGGGGMSRVFVADEAALGRKVVIKVLRPELAEALSAERFKREVRLAARLQHSHIVPLFAAGEIDGGVLYYTMPFVEGESLRERLGREGGLPVAEAVRVLCDVASALAYAHRAGVVHRDVKPENILLSDGGAVVADFGIAKAISASREADGDGDARRSSTLTAAGTSLGTPAYMAPEQAAGDTVDHRADLYALGVVAYEMLAGRAPFDGRTAQQLLAAHATEAPDPIARRRPAVAPALGALIMQLLEKNPADRPQSADELRRTLDGLPVANLGGEAPSVTPAGAERETASGGLAAVAHRTVPAPSAQRRARRVVPWALFGAATALAGVAIGVMLARSRGAEGPRRPVVAAIAAPAGQELRPDGGLALSPDGTRLAFVAADRNGATAVWVRLLDSLEAVRVEGTDGGSGPFWSPRGTSLGYFAGGQLRVADLRAGARRTLCPAPRPGGGTWTIGDVIVYSPDFLSAPLFRVPAAGGPCTQLIRFRAGEFIHRRPSALPDGRHILFSSGTAVASSLHAVDVVTGATTEIRPSGGDPQFAGPDWMLFREAATGSLYAQRLDLGTLRLLGEPRLVFDRIFTIRSIAAYTANSSTLVAFQIPKVGSLVWVDRQSAVVDSVLAPIGAGPFIGIASAGLTSDGRRIAFAAGGPMWIYDRDRKVATRAHAETVAGQGILDPAWGPGDSVIAYRTLFNRSPMLRLYRPGADDSDSLFASGRRLVRTPAWSPEGQRIAFHLSAGDTVANDEIWIYSLTERRAFRAWNPAGNLSSPRWSPDGQWLAYVSDEMGTPEVYVRPVSGPGVAVRVSPAGGDFPRWRADGRELYYQGPDGAVMAVAFRLDATVALSPPRVAVTSPPFSRVFRGFEVTPDGQRFVGFGREDPLLYTLVLDWAARLPAR